MPISKIILQETVGFKYPFQVREIINSTINKNADRRCKSCNKRLSMYNTSKYCFNCQKIESPMYNY